MCKLLVVANGMLERKLLYQILQKQVGNLCEIYEAENETEAMEILETEKIQEEQRIRREGVNATLATLAQPQGLRRAGTSARV